MTILNALPAALFAFSAVATLTALAVSFRRGLVAWRELAGALETCGTTRVVRIRISEPVRPQLRLVEAVRPLPSVSLRGLPEAA